MPKGLLWGPFPGRKRAQSGFTMVEIMVTMGIVGILAAIAVVNYGVFTGRSKQSEAKLALSAIYTQEQSFYRQFNYYIQGLDDIGYTREGQIFYYSVGWTAVSGSGGTWLYRNMRTGANVTTASTASLSRVNFPASWTSCTLATLSSIPGAAATTTGTTFSVTATGQIIKGATQCDTWTIDQSKTLSNTTSGLK